MFVFGLLNLAGCSTTIPIRHNELPIISMENGSVAIVTLRSLPDEVLVHRSPGLTVIRRGADHPDSGVANPEPSRDMVDWGS